MGRRGSTTWRAARRLLPIFFCALISSSKITLADSALTFDDCVKEVLEFNPELQSGIMALRGAKYLEDSARGGYYPQISMKMSGSRGSGAVGGSITDSGGATMRSENQTDSTFDSGSTRTNSSETISLSQRIFDGSAVRSKVDQARAATALQEAELRILRAKISYDLKSSFASLLYGQSYAKLTEDIIRRREENLNIVDLRWRSGHENKGSVLLSRASLGEAKYDRLQAKDSIEVARASLNKVLGRERDVDTRIKGLPPALPPPPSPNFDELALLSPASKKALAEVDSTSAAEAAARSKLYPNLNLQTDFGYRQTDFEGSGDRWDVGLVFSVPIFTGGTNYYGLAGAASQKLSAKAKRRSVLNDTVVSLRQTYAAYGEALERELVDRSYVEAETIRSEIARTKYNNGLISFEDWDIIETNLISRQKSLLKSVRDRITAEAAFEQVQGKGALL